MLPDKFSKRSKMTKYDTSDFETIKQNLSPSESKINSPKPEYGPFNFESLQFEIVSDEILENDQSGSITEICPDKLHPESPIPENEPFQQTVISK